MAAGLILTLEESALKLARRKERERKRTAVFLGGHTVIGLSAERDTVLSFGQHTSARASVKTPIGTATASTKLAKLSGLPSSLSGRGPP